MGDALEFALALVEGEADEGDRAAVVEVGRGVAALLDLLEGLFGGRAIGLELKDIDEAGNLGHEVGALAGSRLASVMVSKPRVIKSICSRRW